MDGFRRDQSCVKTGGVRGCLVIKFCSLWMENNKAMIIRLLIEWQFLWKPIAQLWKSRELAKWGHPAHPSAPRQHHLGPQWARDILVQSIKNSTIPLTIYPRALLPFFIGRCIFSFHPSSVCFVTNEVRYCLPIPYGNGDHADYCWN